MKMVFSNLTLAILILSHQGAAFAKSYNLDIQQAVLAVAQAYKTNNSKQVLNYGLKPWTNDEYQELALPQIFKAGTKQTSPKLTDYKTGLISVIHWQNESTILISFAGFDYDDYYQWVIKAPRSALTYLQNGLSNMDIQALTLVRKVKQRYPDKKIILAGHSLGSRPTQYVAIKENLKAICFAPLGLTSAEIKDIRSELSITEETLKHIANSNLTYLIGEKDEWRSDKTNIKITNTDIIFSTFALLMFNRSNSQFLQSLTTAVTRSYIVYRAIIIGGLHKLFNGKLLTDDIIEVPNAGHSLRSYRANITTKK